MSFFSSWIKVIFITALAFPLYFENSLASPARRGKEPDCTIYKQRLHDCNNQMEPICASNGFTYYNRCAYCSVMLDTNRAFTFKHYGKC
ncbi:PREDICTED: sperm-associated acrosin inhibitor-like [Myotis davidii]|uniref:sperm-associated acrosin inhibitor-like n=1 Tax=Myotis davidii TaxID=225400 RepID=UPI000766E292|nr:PREDICTED: sperm-associated acrosin inhibitor-like [Myotis davidii]